MFVLKNRLASELSEANCHERLVHSKQNMAQPEGAWVYVPVIGGKFSQTTITRRLLQWRLGLVVARWSRSTELLYAGPG